MARKETIKCDWCGEIKEHGTVYSFGLTGSHGVTREFGTSWSSYIFGNNDWDICPKCKRKLLKFIKDLRDVYREGEKCKIDFYRKGRFNQHIQAHS
jgi:hypothetical protein